MAKSKKNKRNKKKQSTKATKQSNSWKSKLPILKFFGFFLLSVALFYLFYYSDWYENNLRDSLLAVQARLGAGLINLFGYNVEVAQELITSDRFSMSIKNGCDGLEATAIFLAAVLAFPLAFKWKIPGLLVGLSVLFVANLIRIAGLYMVGVHWYSAFDFFHLHGGLVLFMFFALVIWIIWINWAFQQEKKYATT